MSPTSPEDCTDIKILIKVDQAVSKTAHESLSIFPPKDPHPTSGALPVSRPGQDKLILLHLHSFPWFQRSPHESCSAGLSLQQFLLSGKPRQGPCPDSLLDRRPGPTARSLITLPSLQDPVAVTGMNLFSDRFFLFAGAGVGHGYNDPLQYVALPLWEQDRPNS